MNGIRYLWLMALLGGLCLGTNAAGNESASSGWTSFQNGGNCEIHAVDLPLEWSSSQGVGWSTPLDGYGQSTPVVWGDTVFVTSCTGEMKETLTVQALDLTTGAAKWSHRLENSTPEKNTSFVSRSAPTPAADEQGVIAFFEGGNLIALDHSGEVRWQRNLVEDYGPIVARHGLASSLEQDGEHVFVWVERSDDPYALAVSKQDGTTTWKAAGVGKTTWSTPRLIPVGDEQHLVLSASGRIVGLEPATGKHLWQFEELANNTTPTPIPLGGGKMLIGASEGRGEQPANPLRSNGVLQVTKQSDGSYEVEYLWRAKKATVSFGSPIVAGGNAYFVNRAGVVHCLDVETGQSHYAKRSPESTWATPIHCGDRVYLFGQHGTTTVLRVGDAFEVMAKNSLWETQAAPDAARFGGPVLYGAAVAGDRILIRRGDRIYCISQES